MRSSDPSGVDPPVGMAIIEAVAEKAGVDPTALPPLHESVDIDALEALFEPIPHGDDRTGTIRFRYAGFIVTVEFDTGETRTIRVEPFDLTGE